LAIISIWKFDSLKLQSLKLPMEVSVGMTNEIFQAVVLGIIQGITEFFPISSTAHLVLAPWFLGWHGLVDSLSFDVALHAGTLFALLICFWRDWLEIIFKKPKMLGLIIVTMIPAGMAGVLFKKTIEHTLRSPLVIAGSLIVIAGVMYAAERVGKKVRDSGSVGFFDAVVLGVSQAFALIPGVSRSGITTVAGMFLGLRREEAARFSFLMATPVIAGAALLEGRHIIKSSDADLHVMGVGVLVSFLVGVVAIKALLKYFKSHSMDIFVYYRTALAVIIILGVWLKN
jgi:undecaprenyl-diphosphatase